MNKKKIALITGGSRGLGRDMAISIAKRGIDVVLTYHNDETAANEVVNYIISLGQKAKAFLNKLPKGGRFLLLPLFHYTYQVPIGAFFL